MKEGDIHRKPGGGMNYYNRALRDKKINRVYKLKYVLIKDTFYLVILLQIILNDSPTALGPKLNTGISK